MLGRKNRAFTMIELLSTIVILAIIALISVPALTGLVSNSKRDALKISARSLMDSAKEAMVNNVDSGEKTFTIENNAFVGDELNTSGILPSSGVVMANGSLEVAIAVTDGKWCIKKNYTDYDITVTEDVNNCNIGAPAACFDFDNSTGTIKNYYDYEHNDSNNPACPKDLIIPNKINNVSILIIDAHAFDTKSLTSVIIPSTVTSVGDYAFYTNVLESINLPSNLQTIGASAFRNNLLSGIIIPDSVTSIGISAFRTNKIASVTFPSGITALPNTIFANNSLKSLNIPNSVTSIGIGAFINNSISNLTLPNTLSLLGGQAFQDNSIRSVTIPTSLTLIDYQVFSSNELTSVTIPSNITSIGPYAFSDNMLISLQLSDGLTTIDYIAFSGNRLTTVTIPSSVTTIGTYAFNQDAAYPWSSVTIKYNGTNLAHRFDGEVVGIGWSGVTMNYVSD